MAGENWKNSGLVFTTTLGTPLHPRNVGHEFKDGPRGKGVIGPLLSPDDRMTIIEYLKSR